jgi:hypothetical protein
VGLEAFLNSLDGSFEGYRGIDPIQGIWESGN